MHLKDFGIMILNLKIVRVNSNYCDYLRKFDNKVSYNKFEVCVILNLF